MVAFYEQRLGLGVKRDHHRPLIASPSFHMAHERGSHTPSTMVLLDHHRVHMSPHRSQFPLQLEFRVLDRRFDDGAYPPHHLGTDLSNEQRPTLAELPRPLGKEPNQGLSLRHLEDLWVELDVVAPSISPSPRESFPVGGTSLPNRNIAHLCEPTYTEVVTPSNPPLHHMPAENDQWAPLADRFVKG